MPIFEYKCNNCNYVMEKIILNSQEEPTKCSNCGDPFPIKIISAPGYYNLVGDGFYQKSSVKGKDND